MLRRTPVISAFLVALAWGPCAGQTVVGRLLESGSERPVPLARLLLLDSSDQRVDVTISDENGRFLLHSEDPGSFEILAERFGYVRASDALPILDEDQVLTIHFYLRPDPIEMERMTVTARRQRAREKLEYAGFYRRAEAGFGHFIAPEDIEAFPPADMLDLLHGVPGVWLERKGLNGEVLYFRSLGVTPANADSMVPQGYCRPLLYVDGARISTGMLGGKETALGEVVDVESVVAVEVHRGASTPLQWGGSFGSCGAIVLWTQSGDFYR